MPPERGKRPSAQSLSPALPGAGKRGGAPQAGGPGGAGQKKLALPGRTAFAVPEGLLVKNDDAAAGPLWTNGVPKGQLPYIETMENAENRYKLYPLKSQKYSFSDPQKQAVKRQKSCTNCERKITC